MITNVSFIVIKSACYRSLVFITLYIKDGYIRFFVFVVEMLLITKDYLAIHG